MKVVAIAGASGALGRELVHALARHGHKTRALIRDPRKRCLVATADQVRLVDLLGSRAAVTEALRGVDVVLSAAGQTTSVRKDAARSSYADVDYRMNKTLLDSALAVGAAKVIYLSVLNGPALRHLAYVDARERVVDEAVSTGIDCTVIRTNAFFSVYLEALPAARRGSLWGLGDPHAVSNPIDERDLAVVCAKAVDGEERAIDVGGPEFLTRQEELEAAFLAVGRVPRVRRLPTTPVRALLPALRMRDRRRAEMLEFVLSVTQRDMTAPPFGTRRLGTYLSEKCRS